MKTLADYICERLYVGELPFTYEEFEVFINKCIIDFDDEGPEWVNMKTVVTNAYGVTGWNMFKGWCESVLGYHHGRNSRITLKQFYDELKRIPLDRISRGLGAGSNGVVWAINDKQIIKFFYGDHIKDCDKPFIEWCSTHESKVFPKVYKYGENWCIMEKLACGTPKIKKWFEYLEDKKFEGKTIYDWVSEKNCDESIFDSFGKEVYRWCKTIQSEMKSMNSRSISWPGDLFQKNCGERPNGDIVFFDI